MIAEDHYSRRSLGASLTLRRRVNRKRIPGVQHLTSENFLKVKPLHYGCSGLLLSLEFVKIFINKPILIFNVIHF